MDTSKKYIKMCEEAPRELWNKVEHYGSLIAWRSFIGIVMPDPDKTKWEGLASVIPETLVLRTWLKEGKESIVVLETNVDYGGSNGDKGTPLYRQDQLQEMLLDRDIKYVKPQIRFYGLLKDFCYNANPNWNRNYYYMTFESFEQLWLAFVMKEKYNKLWNGKEWVADK